MNHSTRAQWDDYQAWAVPCADCAWLLKAFVQDHCAAEGFTRPGDDRLRTLTRRSKSWVTVHKRHLERDGHIVLVSEGRWHGRRAAEYALPWLTDGPVDNRSAAPRKRGAKRGAKRGTSSSLRKEDLARTPARKAEAASVAQSPDDATDPDWCRACEEIVPPGSPCRCPGDEGCEELVNCRAGQRRRLRLVGS